MASIFTKILKGEIPGDIVYEDDIFFVIKDIHPQDRTHLLIIPKEELKDLNELNNNSLVNQKLLEIIHLLAARLESPEYKIQINCGPKAGQEVFHLHIHFISPFNFK